MQEAKGCSSPIIKRTEGKNDTQQFDRLIYQKLIGSLIYLANNTRPDLAFTVSKLSKKCVNPLYGDWVDAKNVLRYLKKTREIKMVYKRTNKPSETYVDADLANETDSKSIGGYVVLLANSTIIWMSRKQKLIATPTSEAEYIAMFEVCKEISWLREFLIFNLIFKIGSSERTKHIKIRYHKVREYVQNGEVQFKYISSNENYE